MVEGYLRSLNNSLDVFSAGTHPEHEISPYAIEVMKEKGIDISRNYPKNAEKFINSDFDFVITVCDNAKESCPVFTGKVRERLHIGFEDPAEARGSKEDILNKYREVRGLVFKKFNEFHDKYLVLHL
jgi:arsenate reductase